MIKNAFLSSPKNWGRNSHYLNKIELRKFISAKKIMKKTSKKHVKLLTRFKIVVPERV